MIKNLHVRTSAVFLKLSFVSGCWFRSCLNFRKWQIAIVNKCLFSVPAELHGSVATAGLYASE